MRKTGWKKAGLLFLSAAVVFVCVFSLKADAEDEQKYEEPALFRPGEGAAYPLLLFTRSFPKDLTGVAIARRTGEVAAATDAKLYYFKGNSPSPAWTAEGEKAWKHTESLCMSWDGSRVLLQSDTKAQLTTEKKNLTVNLYDGQGTVLTQKPNPYRYLNAMLSPSGKYILLGELMHESVKCYDYNLNLLWEKPMQFWYLAFDPQEHYLFDGEKGVLYTIEGVRVWEYGRYTRILSVSDNAEFVMTQYFRQVAASQRMFLMGRLALKKIELAGEGGCVSPDGLYTAYVNADKKLVVYRTLEVLENGAENIPPLFEDSFLKPRAIQISRDNRSLFIMGEKNLNLTVMALVDLTKMKKAWEKPVEPDLRIALPTEDNRFVLIQPSRVNIKKLRCY